MNIPISFNNIQFIVVCLNGGTWAEEKQPEYQQSWHSQLGKMIANIGNVWHLKLTRYI